MENAICCFGRSSLWTQAQQRRLLLWEWKQVEHIAQPAWHRSDCHVSTCFKVRVLGEKHWLTYYLGCSGLLDDWEIVLGKRPSQDRYLRNGYI